MRTAQHGAATFQGAAIMGRRTAIVVLTVSVSLFGLCAHAADAGGTSPALLPAAADVTLAVPVLIETPAVPVLTETTATRPLALPALYVSFAALQIFDGYSTSRALARGGRETNPLMQGVVGSSAALWTVKAATTAASILLAEKMWRTHPVRAVVVLAVTNGFYAIVAMNNARTLNQQR